MNKTNSYYGYERNFEPMRAERIKTQLDKLVRYNNIVYRYADYLALKLTEEGYTPNTDIIEWGVNGKLSKPKTEYQLIKDNKYHVINQTKYDFCRYFMENFKSLEDVQNYLEEEQKQADAEKAEQERKEAEAEKVKAQQAEEIKAFKEWFVFEREKYMTAENITLVTEIFNYYYGTEFSEKYPPCVDVLILADNINNPHCRNDLISRLHNDNKASIKIFEVYTGIKLASGYKERMEQLKNITVEDYKKNTLVFKARKTTEHKEKQIEEYYKHIRNNDGAVTFIKAEGEKMTVNGFAFYIEKSGSHYIATEEITGLLATYKPTKKEIKQTIKEFAENKKQMLDVAIKRAIENKQTSPLYTI